MLFLIDFDVIKPDVGLIFWTTIFFAVFWWLMSRYAFKPIANALKKREHDIQDALDEAKKAKEEMANLHAENEKLIQVAREERAAMLKEAKDTKNAIIKEAKDKAKQEANTIVKNAKAEIETSKQAALVEVKNQVGNMALEIAEKVIRKQLAGNAEQESFVDSLVKELKV